MSARRMGRKAQQAAAERARLDWREALAEGFRIERYRPPDDDRSLDELRHAVLVAIADPAGHFYDAAALELLAAFEGRLRQVWERIDRQEARDRAVEAINTVLGVPPQWRMF